MSDWLQPLLVAVLVFWALYFLGREIRKSMRGFSSSGSKSCSTCGCDEKQSPLAKNEKNA